MIHEPFNFSSLLRFQFIRSILLLAPAIMGSIASIDGAQPAVLSTTGGQHGQADSLPRSSASSFDDDGLRQALEEARHQIREIEPRQKSLPINRDARFFCHNPASRISARFGESGILLESAAHRFGGVTMNFNGKPTTTNPEQTGTNRISYRHDIHTEEIYINEPRGLKHEIHLSAGNPELTSTDGFTEIGFTLSNLRSAPDPGNPTNLVFTDTSGALVYGYQDLYIYDTDGKTLEGTLEPTDTGFLIRADTRNARFPVVIDPLVVSLAQSEGLDPVTPPLSDNFGSSISIGNGIAVVGAPDEDTADGPRIGVVYVFEESNHWNLAARIENPDLYSSNLLQNSKFNADFGFKVLVVHNMILVTALNRLEHPTAFGSSISYGGKVHTYQRSEGEWHHIQTLSSQIEGGNRYIFGHQMACDSDTLVIAAPLVSLGFLDLFEDTPPTGFVHTYRLVAGRWEPGAVVTRPDGSGVGNPAFARSIALDSGTLFVGDGSDQAPHQHGVVYLFENSGDTWQHAASISGNAAEDGFGTVLAVADSVMLVGTRTSPALVPLHKNHGSWVRSPAIDFGDAAYDTRIGRPLLIHGSRMIVELTEAYGYDGGSIRSVLAAFRMVDEEWVLDAILEEASRDFRDDSHVFVASTTDEHVLTSNRVTKQVSLYQLHAGNGIEPLKTLRTRAQDDTSNIGFGASVALDQGLAAVGAPAADTDIAAAAGAVYLFEKRDQEWEFLQRIEPPDGVTMSGFGRSVALDGGLLLVGAPGQSMDGKLRAGAAFLFESTNEGWQFKERFISGIPREGGGFGHAVAITDGWFAISSHSDRNFRKSHGGSVDLYRASGGLISHVKTLADHEQDFRCGFGAGISLDSGRLAVGAPYRRFDGDFRSGAVHIYELSGGEWHATTILQPASPNEEFGWSVAIENDRLVVGAPNHREQWLTGFSPQGCVYFYSKSDGNWIAKRRAEPLWSPTLLRQRFGSQVALSGDRAVALMKRGPGTLAFGYTGPLKHGGVAAFDYSGGTWSSGWWGMRDVVSSSEGEAIAIEGHTVAVTFLRGSVGDEDVTTGRFRESGTLLVFEDEGDSWRAVSRNHAAENRPLIGFSIALWGNTCVVGADRDGTAAGIFSGAAYVMKRTADGWEPRQVLEPDPAYLGGFFGAGVAVHSDIIVVGAPSDTLIPFNNSKRGAAYIFQRADSGYFLRQRYETWSSNGCDLIALNRDMIALGSRFSDVTVLKRGRRDEWTVSGAFVPQSGKANLHLAVSGNLVTAVTQELVLVFERINGSWTEVHRMNPPADLPGVNRIEDAGVNGNRIVVLCRTTAGDAVVTSYLFNGVSWVNEGLVPAGIRASDSPPLRISTSGGLVLIGEPKSDLFGLSSGAVHIFSMAGSPQSLSLLEVNHAPVPQQNAYYGSSVGIAPGSIIVGAYPPDNSGGAVFYHRYASPEDVDGDGLPDQWEILHGMDPGDDGTIDPANGSFGNADGDFWDNLEEYLLGLNPNVHDSHNVPLLIDVRMTPAGAVLAEGSNIDLGTIPVGVRVDREIYIRNLGPDGAMLEVSFPGPAGPMEVTSPAEARIPLAAGAMIEVPLSVFTTDVGSHELTITLAGGENDPDPYLYKIRATAVVTADAAFQSEVRGRISCIVMDGSRGLLYGGDLTDMDGVRIGIIARTDMDGKLTDRFESFNAMFNSSSMCNSIAVARDGSILVAGSLWIPSLLRTPGLFRLRPDGSLDAAFQQPIEGVINQVGIDSRDRIVVAGTFTPSRYVETVPQGLRRRGIARLFESGQVDGSFAVTGADDGTVTAFAIGEDDTVYVSGSFASFDSLPRPYLVRLAASGGIDPDFTSPVGSGIQCLELDAHGSLVVGGRFDVLGGGGSRGLARILANGSLDPSFNPVVGTNSHSVWTVRIQADGRILLIGNFSTVNGVNRSRFARLNADGSIDAGFSPPPGPTVAYSGMQLLPSGRLALFPPWISQMSVSGFNIGLPKASLEKADGHVVFSKSGPGMLPRQVRFHVRNTDGEWTDLGFGERVGNSWSMGVGDDPSLDGVRISSRMEAGAAGLVEWYFPLGVQSLTALEAWRVRYFGSALNDGLGADFSDFNGDGTLNIVRFVSGQSPTLAGPPPGMLQVIDGFLKFDFTLAREASDMGLGFVPEWSRTMAPGSWSASGFSFSVLKEENGIRTIRASLADLNSPSAFFRLRVAHAHEISPTSPRLAQWKLDHLGSATASDLGDTDGDGLAELVEYAFLSSPTTPDGSHFTPSLFIGEGASYLSIRVPRDPMRDDIIIEIQVTGDPVNGQWTTVATSTLGGPFTGPGYVSGEDGAPGPRLVLIRDTTPISAAPRRFIRARVGFPGP